MSDTMADESMNEAIEQPQEVVQESVQTPAANDPEPGAPPPEPAEVVQPRKAQFEPLGSTPSPSAKGANSMEMLLDVPMGVTVELGRTSMAVQEVLDLQSGSVIELDHLAGEAVDIFINNHLLAKGEVVVVDDRFGVRVTQILANGNGKGLH